MYEFEFEITTKNKSRIYGGFRLLSEQATSNRYSAGKPPRPKLSPQVAIRIHAGQRIPLFFIIVSVSHQLTPSMLCYLEEEIFKASKWGFGICSEQQYMLLTSWSHVHQATHRITSVA